MKFGRAHRSQTSARVRHLEAVSQEHEPWQLPWQVTSALAALVTAGAGWILVAAYGILGWISVPQLRAAAVLAFSTKGWLLAHGISATLPGAQVSIMPLGLTAIILVIGLGVCHQAVIHTRPPAADELGGRLLRMAGVFAVIYVIALTGARQVVESGSGASTLVGGLIFACALPLAGFARGLEWRPTRGVGWIRTIGLSLAAGLLVMIATGAAVVIAALIIGRAQVMMIHESLMPGGLGGVMLILGQLAWLPNLILWGGAWAVGAGIQFGLGTVISPAQSTIGLLPSIPFLGAMPQAGPMPRGYLLWLISGVLAGVVTAWALVKQLLARSSAQSRPLGVDLTAIFGALAGIGCGLVFTLLQLPAGGDLGSVRLTSLGAKMTALLVLAPSTMGLAGMVTGAVLGWRAMKADEQPASSDLATDDSPEQALEPAGSEPTTQTESGEDARAWAEEDTAPLAREFLDDADEADVPTTVVEDRSKPSKRDR